MNKKLIIIFSSILVFLLSLGVVYSTSTANTKSYAQVANEGESQVAQENPEKTESDSTGLQQITNPGNAEAAEGTLVNPTDAEAGIVGDAVSRWAVNWAINKVTNNYQALCTAEEYQANGNSCPLNGRQFFFFVAKNATDSAIYFPLCGKYSDDLNEADCLDIGLLSGIPGRSMVVPNDGNVYRSSAEGGFFIASALNGMSNEPPVPTDLALFIDDTFQDTLIGQPAFAQTIYTGGYRVFVLETWKYTRNIALSLMGVMVAIAALMVMFRAQIAPRVTVSIFNVLPMIPIVLGLIILSYPIMSVALAMTIPLSAFAFKIGYLIVRDAFLTNPLEAIPNPDVETFGVFWALALNFFFGLPQILGLAAWFIIIVVPMFVIGLIVVTLALIWAAVKTYISMMFNTIAAPIIILTAMIPGRTGVLVNLGKRILVDVLTIPVIILGGLVGFAIIAYVPANNTDVAFGGVMTYLYSGTLLISLILKSFVGFAIIWKSTRARPMLEKALGVGGLMSTGAEQKR